jgi:hypothetical protein
LDAGAWRAGLDLLAATQGLARGFGNNDRGDATLRRGLARTKRQARIVFYSRSRRIFFAIKANRSYGQRAPFSKQVGVI